MLTYKENQFNMFDHKAPDEILAHCISSDFVMGAGVARVFTEMGVKTDLMANYPQKWEGKGYCILSTIPNGNNKGQTVANLITKEKVWLKPTYRNIAEALIDLRDQLIAKGETINKIVIPYLGCGIDGKEWKKVSKIMCSVFSVDERINFDIELNYLEDDYREGFSGSLLKSDKQILDKADEYDTNYMFNIKGLIEGYIQENKDSVLNEVATNQSKNWTDEQYDRFKIEMCSPQFIALKKAVFEQLEAQLNFNVFKTEVQNRYESLRNDTSLSRLDGFNYMIELKRAEFLSEFTTKEAYEFTKIALSKQYKDKDFEKEIRDRCAYYAYSKANHTDSDNFIVDPIRIYSDDYAEIRKIKQLTGRNDAERLYLKELGIDYQETSEPTHRPVKQVRRVNKKLHDEKEI